MKRFSEYIVERLLMASGAITSLVILLIIVFLFKQGAGLFSKNSVEPGYSIVMNRSNTVNTLTASEIKQIFDGEYSNWIQLGGSDSEIKIFRIDNITEYATEEELGEEFQYIPKVISRIIKENSSIIAYVPDIYLETDAEFKKPGIEKMTLKQFFNGREWFPTATPSALFGTKPLILGSLWVSLGAILFALPFGLAVAIYMAELASSKMRNLLKPIIELLSGIPSVVYGFFGLVVIVPLIQKVFNLPVGETGLAGAFILAIMALPTIITVAEDAIRTVPIVTKEASLALGATHLQTIFRVTLPYCISGLMAAIVLGIGRAIGETMAVLMVTGNSAVIPSSLIQPMRTIPATIAAELGEAPAGGTHYEALFMLGTILFVITMIISIIAEVFSARRPKQR